MLKPSDVKITGKRFSVVIPTIGRKTLNNAVDSVLREKCEAVVISDGFELCREDYPCIKRPGVIYHKLQRNYGMMNGKIYFGQVASGVGIFLASNEFSMLIGDDDELMVGSGEFIRKKLESNPEVDIWIPGLKYNDGFRTCIRLGGLNLGNVSHPCYRNSVVAFVPLFNDDNDDPQMSDFQHIEKCSKKFKVDWFNEYLVLVRPNLPGRRGFGDRNR
jgi:hypothetical protein